MSNLDIWERFANIDPQFTKRITGKDYGGTSPNAHYVVRCLTEMFGPVGQGFGWRVVAEDISEFDGTHIHWCRIEFWHTDRANTFESYGQTKMAYLTNNGKYKVDEDAPKKSLTDAITKAAAQIGIAANIFLGRWDDNGYVQDVANSFREQEKASPDQVAAREEAIAQANEYLTQADSIDDLKDRWGKLPKHVQKEEQVIAAKDARKSSLQQLANNNGGDEIQH